VDRQAWAHKTNLARAVVTVEGDTVTYRLSLSAHDLAVALGIETDLVAPVPRDAFEARSGELDRYLTERLVVAAQATRCPATDVGVDYQGLPETVTALVRFGCPESIRRLRIDYGVFFDIDRAHRALGALRVGDERVEEFLLDQGLPFLEIDLGQSEPDMPWTARMARIVTIGVEHILSGYDHLLFLLSLLLATPRFWPLLKVVTAFTLAHTATLALAWFGLVSLPERLTETLIAASIAYVAAENVLGFGVARRWLVAGAFGLVHGLGFYGALKSLELGRGDAVGTLVAFNLGVEAGQVAVVAVLFAPLVAWAKTRWFEPSSRLLSAAVFLVALWWVVQRAVLA
jgi:hypothetical protein